MTLAPGRAAALRLLREVRVRSAWGHELLADVIGGAALDDRDAAFATRLAYGVLASEGTLDEVLDRFVDRPSRVHPRVRDALRAATYELLFMRTPDHVAVHQGVEAVRRVERRASGLANAVLRRVAESAPTFPWGDPETDAGALARATAHPDWLVDLIVAELGLPAARTMLEADNEPAPLFLAHNPFAGTFPELVDRLEREGVAPDECVPEGCVRAGSPSAAVRSGALREGACVVADAAAQFVASVAAPKPGGRCVELAAGRGTKTMLIQATALRAGGTAEMISADVHEFKVRLLDERMHALGVPDVRAVQADTADHASLSALGGPASADVVMVDAPCSGLGTLRRHPEARWRLTETTIEQLAQVGAQMLSTAALLVRPGGFVVYSTCTVTDRENRAVVEGFLGTPAGREFAAVSLESTVPAEWARFVTTEGWFQSIPEATGPDGHFVAVIARS